jgi:hypothetical protein
MSRGGSAGRALSRPGVTRVWPAAAPWGGLLQTDDGLHTDGDGGQSVRDNHSRGRMSER